MQTIVEPYGYGEKMPKKIAQTIAKQVKWMGMYELTEEEKGEV